MNLLYLIIIMFVISSCNDNNKKQVSTPLDSNKNTPYDRSNFIIRKNINGLTFERQLSDDFIEFYLSQQEAGSAPLIPIDRLFVNPINLLILNELTKRTIEIFEDNNITYWAEGGTVLSAERFASLMPWDDDADLGFDLYDAEKKISDIKKSAISKGLVILGPCFKGDGMCFVRFSEETYIDIVKAYDPSLSLEKIQSMYSNIPRFKDHGEIDLFPFNVNDHRVKHSDGWHAPFIKNGGPPDGYNYTSVFPLQKKQINDFTVNVIHSPEHMYKIWYGSEDILYSIHMFNHINGGYKSLFIKDIRQYPGFLEIILEYLKFVFSDSFEGFAEAYQVYN